MHRPVTWPTTAMLLFAIICRIDFVLRCTDSDAYCDSRCEKMPDTINPGCRATRRVEREHRIRAADTSDPRLHVDLLSRKVISVTQSDSASFGTAASVVAAAEGAGHFSQEKSFLLPRLLTLSAVQGIVDALCTRSLS
jgi:hypothetical protein